MDKYAFNKEIGRGSFGKVFLIESRQTGIQYVLKQVDLNKLDKKQAKSASKEVEVLSKLKHFHIVRYKESYEHNNHLCIIMEYCENGDLHKKIKEQRIKNECFSDNEILEYFVQICLALEYLHEQKILHRDLKTKNIFLTKGNVIKLGDFGVAKVLENSFELASTCIGSPYYISPEICDNKPYNKKSDIWALGCVLYEISTLKYAFVARNVKILITKITTGSFNPLPVNINTQIRSLLINLLKPNPKDRPTASEILAKPFLQKYRFKYGSDCSKNAGVAGKRSSSGDRSKQPVKLNNELKVLSSSCTKLNDMNKKRNKFTAITTPETKYKVPFFNNKFKCLRKYKPLSFEKKCNDGPEFTESDKPNGVCLNEWCYQPLKSEAKEKTTDLQLTNAGKGNLEKTKIVKILKVDSEYYNLIAESNKSKNSLDAAANKGDFQPSEVLSNGDGESGIDDHCLENKGEREMNESRRRWMANTLDKKELLTVLGEAELIDVTAVRTPVLTPLDKERSNITLDDLLKLDPSEMSEDILQPVKLEETIPVCGKVSYLNLLKEEIREIKAKFEANNKNYDVQDLMRLTENSRKILKEEISRKYSGDEHYMKNDSDSVYFDLELKRMQLEKTVGLATFLMTYKKMIDILNGNIQSDKKEEPVVSGADTYVIQRDEHTGDHKKPVENTWMSILEAFGTKKEYIPDMWDCAGVASPSFYTSLVHFHSYTPVLRCPRLHSF